MNDFTEIECELKKLRPVAASEELVARIARDIERADATPSSGVVHRTPRFRVSWLGLGLGLAAATAFLVLARIDFHKSRNSGPTASANSSSPIPKLAAANYLVPDGLTQVVYHTLDEGLVYPSNSPEPMRRIRSHSRETLQWRNPQTGASLRVTYPTEQVELIPISGQ